MLNAAVRQGSDRSTSPMAKNNDIKTYNDLSEKYSTWIIEYCSISFETSLFMVWYTDTDENSTDRLLTFKSGEILAVTSLTNLKATILSSVESLIEFENLNAWLANFNDLEVTTYCTYDLTKIVEEIDKSNLDIETIEGFANFMNLFGDFINQDERNTSLQSYADNKLIKKICKYYYEYIFWPRFNDKEKSENWDRPQLAINTKELSVKLKDVIKSFEDNIKLTEKAIG